MKLRVFAAAVATNIVLVTCAIALDLDPELPAYNAVNGVAGQAKSVGSDTLSNLMALWAEGFKAKYPNLSMEIEAKGSATAPPALLEGISQLGPMSRPMKSEEYEAFNKRYGYNPAHFRVAVDALAVYVNRDNPLQCLTMQQLDQIFSKTRQGSGGREIKAWDGVGLTGDWEAKPISLYGRNSTSGTYEFFREMALYNGEYKDEVKEQSDSVNVVQMVANDRFAIGYSGIGYKTPGVRSVPLAVSAGRKCYDTSAESTFSGDYPMARYLYIYLNKNPNQPLDALVAEFAKYVLSKDGQALTLKGGFYTITNAMRLQDLRTLGISTDTN